MVNEVSELKRRVGERPYRHQDGDIDEIEMERDSVWLFLRRLPRRLWLQYLYRVAAKHNQFDH